MFKKIILLVAIFATTHLSALTNSQKDKIITSYNIGKTIVAKDGMTFENTLPSIMGQESSWGTDNLGDKFDKTGRLKSLYDSSLGNFQIKLSTAKITIKMYPELKAKYGYLVNKEKSTYKKYQIHYKKLNYYKEIVNSEKWNERVRNGEKKAIKTMKWAKKEFLYHHTFFSRYKKQAKQDTMLINKLMYDFEFGAIISGHYLKHCYELALRKFGKSEAYWRGVGRYNGGWSNRAYHGKILSRMKTVKKIIKED